MGQANISKETENKKISVESLRKVKNLLLVIGFLPFLGLIVLTELSEKYPGFSPYAFGVGVIFLVGIWGIMFFGLFGKYLEMAKDIERKATPSPGSQLTFKERLAASRGAKAD